MTGLRDWLGVDGFAWPWVLLALLQGCGVRAMALSCADPSEAWLPLLDQPKGRAR